MDKSRSFILAQSIWDNVLSNLEKKINKQSFSMWLKDTEPLSIKGDSLQIKVKDDVAVRHLNDKYLKDIEEIIESTTGKKYSCEFITEIEFNDMEAHAKNEYFNNENLNFRSENRGSQLNNSSTMLNQNYTFENFVVGPNNQLAHAAAKSVSRSLAT